MLGKNLKERNTMNNVKRIGILLLVLCLIPGFAQAASKPDATLRLSGRSVAAGLGVSWGNGTLTYKGKNYPVSVSGLSLVKVGISKITASGRVYNLKRLQDFDGTYTAVRADVTLAGGGSTISLKNQNGVRVNLSATTRGVDFTLGANGVDMHIKK
jgi:hypothetical protein